jgi:3-hydroxyisobutyrate dehydrogenase-like beta-hydroxyacid dehydrogenase
MIGLGIMGSAMSANIMRAGYRVIGYDVAGKPRLRHRRAGGLAAASCGDVAAQAEVIICSLPSSKALLQTAEALRLRPARSPRPPIVIETSTLPIAVKEEARQILSSCGAILLDCPLSGTGAQARVKDLVVYGSGDRRAYRRVVPVLEAFARAEYYVGAFGAGSKMKFVANLLVAVHNVAAAEAIVLGMKAGLDPALVVKVIGDGAGSSRMFQVRGPLMAKGDYSRPTMKLDVWEKDMTIIADFAREVGCRTPLFAATGPIYTAARADGGERDTAAVCAVVEEMAGLDRRSKAARPLRRARRTSRGG